MADKSEKHKQGRFEVSVCHSDGIRTLFFVRPYFWILLRWLPMWSSNMAAAVRASDPHYSLSLFLVDHVQLVFHSNQTDLGHMSTSI